MSEFKGSAKKISEKDYEEAAEKLGCDVAAVKAVVSVEAGKGGGFLKDGRPKILFESRWFHKLTGGKHDESHPHLSTSTWVRNYKGGAGEYTRLEEAIKLDRSAALKSASWGCFQILGVNHNVAGFKTVDAFVKAQVKSEG
ncbi:MAG: N-acetylmuramidase domain-containing protein, partial [Rubricoccaceae bacterium]|nr:N-acetylmuramidase domain-containing protein [Rubricoccaceae bacterium]